MTKVRSTVATAIAVGSVVVAAATAVVVGTSDAGESDTSSLQPLAVVEAKTTVSAPRRLASQQSSLSPTIGELSVGAADDVPETGGLTDLIRSYFGGATVEAIVIVQCESNFDRLATNENDDGTMDHGLFQINDVHMNSFEPVTGKPWADRYDAETNVAFARWLWGHAGGWGPWRCNIRLDGSSFDESPEGADESGL